MLTAISRAMNRLYWSSSGGAIHAEEILLRGSGPNAHHGGTSARLSAGVPGVVLSGRTGCPPCSRSGSTRGTRDAQPVRDQLGRFRRRKKLSSRLRPRIKRLLTVPRLPAMLTELGHHTSQRGRRDQRRQADCDSKKKCTMRLGERRPHRRARC